MSDVFRKKCPGCNGIVEYHTTCVPCSQRKRTELHASGLCLTEEHAYRKARRRTPNPREKFAEFKKAYSPQTDLQFDSLREVYEPLTVTGTGSKHMYGSAMDVAEEHGLVDPKWESDWDRWASGSSITSAYDGAITGREWLASARFHGTPVGLREIRERSAEALLNFIEHSSKPLKDEMARVEAQLYRMRAIAPKSPLSFAMMAEIFGRFLNTAVRTFRADMSTQAEFKLGIDVRRHCVMRLIQNYQAGDRVGG
jgi:hypothetical protein